MSGNVYEWVEDIYSGGSYRVIRGGSWYNAPAYVRCASRGYFTPADRSYIVGFRLVRTF